MWILLLLLLTASAIKVDIIQKPRTLTSKHWDLVSTTIGVGDYSYGISM